MEQFVERYKAEPQLASVARDIDQVEKLIEQVTAPRRRLEVLIRKMFSGPKELRVSDTGIEAVSEQGSPIGLASLSSGEKHALRIFTEALLVPDSLILIDEPELSLHVDWQRILVQSLRELAPESQLIIATHSPEIMAEIPDDKIFRI